MSKLYRAVLKTFSGWFQNLSAAWFGLVFIVPNFANIQDTEPFTLTAAISFGILFLLLSMLFEYFLN